MAGLDKPIAPFSAADASDHPLNTSESRHNTTLQMKSFLEQSRFDESSFLSDSKISCAGPARSRYHDDINHSDRTYVASDSSRLRGDVSSAQIAPRRGGMNFDELYQKALEDTENVLSSSTFPTPRDGSNGIVVMDAKLSHSDVLHHQNPSSDMLQSLQCRDKSANYTTTDSVRKYKTRANSDSFDLPAADSEEHSDGNVEVWSTKANGTSSTWLQNGDQLAAKKATSVDDDNDDDDGDDDYLTDDGEM